jgi:hypothetical protein
MNGKRSAYITIRKQWVNHGILQEGH